MSVVTKWNVTLGRGIWSALEASGEKSLYQQSGLAE
jgi:hypothetical protein